MHTYIREKKGTDSGIPTVKVQGSFNSTLTNGGLPGDLVTEFKDLRPIHPLQASSWSRLRNHLRESWIEETLSCPQRGFCVGLETWQWFVGPYLEGFVYGLEMRFQVAGQDAASCCFLLCSSPFLRHGDGAAGLGRRERKGRRQRGQEAAARRWWGFIWLGLAGLDLFWCRIGLAVHFASRLIAGWKRGSKMAAQPTTNWPNSRKKRKHVTHYRAFATALEPAPIAGSRQQVMCGFYHKLLLDRAGPKLFFLFFFNLRTPLFFLFHWRHYWLY
jgi:hypothetical protein